MAQSDIYEIYNLEDFKVKILRLLTQDTIISKDTFAKRVKIVDGKEVKYREYNGRLATSCKMQDWKTGNKKVKGKMARERVRMILHEITAVVKEARKFTLTLDKRYKSDSND